MKRHVDTLLKMNTRWHKNYVLCYYTACRKQNLERQVAISYRMSVDMGHVSTVSCGLLEETIY